MVVIKFRDFVCKGLSCDTEVDSHLVQLMRIVFDTFSSVLVVAASDKKVKAGPLCQSLECGKQFSR